MARIGVVDDSPEMRAALRSVLELDDHRVWEAADGSAVLAMTLAPDDILLLDSRMPGMDGFTLLEALAGRAEGMPRVIMMSAEGSQSDRHRAQAAGAVAYLTKPFDVVELLTLIETLTGAPEP